MRPCHVFVVLTVLTVLTVLAALAIALIFSSRSCTTNDSFEKYVQYVSADIITADYCASQGSWMQWYSKITPDACLEYHCCCPNRGGERDDCSICYTLSKPKKKK